MKKRETKPTLLTKLMEEKRQEKLRKQEELRKIQEEEKRKQEQAAREERERIRKEREEQKQKMKEEENRKREELAKKQKEADDLFLLFKTKYLEGIIDEDIINTMKEKGLYEFHENEIKEMRTDLAEKKKKEQELQKELQFREKEIEIKQKEIQIEQSKKKAKKTNSKFLNFISSVYNSTIQKLVDLFSYILQFVGISLFLLFIIQLIITEGSVSQALQNMWEFIKTIINGIKNFELKN